MSSLTPYRVLSRLQALAVVAVLVAFGGIVTWLGLRWMELHFAQLDALQQSSPRAALAAMVIDLKIMALVQILPLTAFSGFMIWYARRAIESQSLPPAGGWVVEGQRISTGAAAIRTARILLGLTALLTLVGAAEIGFVYYIATTLQARIPDF